MDDIKLAAFLHIDVRNNYGYGYGHGHGDGRGDGYGHGDGDSYGHGYGDGDGDGYGFGDGFGDGDGSGHGDGYGHGHGHGSSSSRGYGRGDGEGRGIKKINSHTIHNIDDIPTIITYLKNNIAKGYILQKDLTLKPCYIVKQDNLFSHGETLKEAMESLREKLFNNLDVDERINVFLKEFEFDKKYLAINFFEWHNKLTGSCLMGREQFCSQHDIDIKKDEFTVAEFIALTENSYGKNVINKLKSRYEKLSLERTLQ